MAALLLARFLPAETVPTEKQPVRASTVTSVQSALEADPELLRNHRGFLACLAERQDFARAESAWIGVCRRLDFGPVARDFDEALLAEPAIGRLFDAFYDALARDAGLRGSVEATFRAQFERPTSAKPAADAFAYLRAHPEFAARFLENPRAAQPVPDEVRPYLNEFLEDDSGLANALRAPLANVSASPLGQTGVLPWWQGVQTWNGASVYTAMLDHFARYPNHFWIWHERELALASDGNLRQWVRYWGRRVRRNPELVRGYLDYLDQIAYDAPQRQRVEAEWNKRFGDAEAWPPNAAPPPVTSDALHPPDEIAKPVVERPALKTTTTGKNTRRPAGIAMPSMPTMPTAPKR